MLSATPLANALALSVASGLLGANVREGRGNWMAEGKKPPTRMPRAVVSPDTIVVNVESTRGAAVATDVTVTGSGLGCSGGLADGDLAVVMLVERHLCVGVVIVFCHVSVEPGVAESVVMPGAVGNAEVEVL
jgi:hypothetical protein